MSPIEKRQQEVFYSTLIGPVMAICPNYGVDPRKCLKDAALRSRFGKYAIGNNYWKLPGHGSAGQHQLITIRRTPHSSENGGVQPEVRRFAVFKTVADAVEAYCKHEKRSRT